MVQQKGVLRWLYDGLQVHWYGGCLCAYVCRERFKVYGPVGKGLRVMAGDGWWLVIDAVQ